MFKSLVTIQSPSLDPYFNQAIEASLTELVQQDTLILYIWANDKTVFIGKNQNAFRECDVAKLRANGGKIARRVSGGGAVYHDKGNLNFTFVCHRQGYSLGDNFAVVLDAVRAFGIDAELSGRNDLQIEGKKFSGNAFFVSANGCFHHGTILINTMASEIAKYLNVSTAKTSHRAVKSVPSRVTNLARFHDQVTFDSFAHALEASFVGYWRNRYKDATVARMQISQIDAHVLNRWQQFFADEARIMGDDIQYNFGLEHRFDWGTADIRLQLEDGIITRAKIYSDALECDIAGKESTLIGKRLTQEDELVGDILRIAHSRLQDSKG